MKLGDFGLAKEVIGGFLHDVVGGELYHAPEMFTAKGYTVNRRCKCYSNTTVYYGIHKRSECIAVDSGVTNLIHERRSCVYFTLGSRGECGSMCLLKREQARRETQQWVMRRLPTADSIVEIGRKSRS